MCCVQNYGNGYRATRLLVGNAAGLHTWELSRWRSFARSRRPATHRAARSILFQRFEYYWEFFKDHTTGTTEVFILEWRSKKYHASFAEPELGFEQLTADLFAISRRQGPPASRRRHYIQHRRIYRQHPARCTDRAVCGFNDLDQRHARLG
jgi:hypothetical protein